jgi:RHS repeat-associated protein
MLSLGSPELLLGPIAGTRGIVSFAENLQLDKNSRPGSEGRNRAPAQGFAALKSQTIQRDSWHLSGGTASGPSVYLYDGMDPKANPVEEVDNSGNILARYTEGEYVDEPLAEVRGTNTSYYEADTVGSITSLTNPAASLTNSYIYDAFGNVTTTSGTLTNPFRFTGRDSDPETNLSYYRARYYSPQVGRFISEDPVQFGGGDNFFAYVRNNPLRFKDPSGLITIDGSCSCSQDRTHITWATPLAIAAAARITDPGLRDCVINRLTNGVVKCGGNACDKGAKPDAQGKVLWGHALPFGHTITLCSFAFSSDIATPCLLIHEFAHTCTHGENTADKAMNQSFPGQCPGI